MKMLVTRDAQGKCINIGPWDEQPEEVAIVGADGEPLLGPSGSPVLKIVKRNPMPTGCTQAEENIVVLSDGSRFPASDELPEWAKRLAPDGAG